MPGKDTLLKRRYRQVHIFDSKSQSDVGVVVGALAFGMVKAEAIVPQPWTIHCDGSAVPNPGRMGLGAVLVAPDGTRHGFSVATDARGCNNEAEARALMLALREAQARGATVLQIYSDSSLLVAQLGVSGAPPVLRLAELYEELAGVLATFAPVTVNWIPRHRNAEADALARAAVGLAPKQPMKPKKKNRRRR